MCVAGLALAAPHADIYSGLWGYNSALSCIAIGGVFYVLTWQTHILALTCGKTVKHDQHRPSRQLYGIKICKHVFSAFFCAYMTAAISKLMSVVSQKLCSRFKVSNVTRTPRHFSDHVSRSPLLWHPLSARITGLHVAFLPVDSHLPPHFLQDPSHLQTASVCGLLPRGKSALPETIKGLRESSVLSAERRPRGGPDEGEWRPECPLGHGEGLQ